MEPSIAAELEGGGPYKFWPSIDPQSANPFMPYNPLTALRYGRQKDIPTILGVTSGEGAVFVATVFNQVRKKAVEYYSSF